ncbi:unnamed protein product [Didymodactylos carnosus]|uniref:Uncharacterized protein n=1 Tax=Didymodactylos carnosus TaxID=1234261 RepID=A0A813Y752_9BILA|nr:unnamed protein product [Didymodactylos carnosus]CAF0878425.1 unnamed protein product [Didymodactylos carnosus]CAF3603597.1 unnamed protein product [Didymodactylos carnosus]CAF3664988.1 unnamed protein product [Didymodactylos carnosus]
MTKPNETSISLVDVDESMFHHFRCKLFPKIQTHITRLRLSDISQILTKKFSKKFSNLSSLQLVFNNMNDIRTLLWYSKSLGISKSLVELSVVFEICSHQDETKGLLNKLYRSLLFQPGRKLCSLKSLSITGPPCLSLTIKQYLMRPCYLRRLTIHLISYNDLLILFNNLPLIEYFSVALEETITGIYPYTYENIFSGTKLLSEFHFYCPSIINYDLVELLLKQLVTLRKLSLRLCCKLSNGIIDGQRLESGFLRKLTRLEQFNFCICSCYVDNGLGVIDDYFLSTFQTDYWIKEKHWKIGFYSMPYAFIFYITFSLPFAFDVFDSTSTDLLKYRTNFVSCNDNGGDNWKQVKNLYLFDDKLYTRNFFQLIHDKFTNIKQITIENHLSIESHEKVVLLPSVCSVRFVSLNKYRTNAEHVKQLLLMTPNIRRLKISYILLARATNYFRDQQLQKVCSNVVQLDIDSYPQQWSHSGGSLMNLYAQRFKTYFSNL